MAGEGGSAALPVLGLLAVVAAMALGVAQVGEGAARRAAAQAAADAAALAGAAGGRGVAEQVAAANDARLRTYVVEGDDVVVAVERRNAVAEARARWVPSWDPSTRHERITLHPINCCVCLPSAPGEPEPKP